MAKGLTKSQFMSEVAELNGISKKEAVEFLRLFLNEESIMADEHEKYIKIYKYIYINI